MSRRPYKMDGCISEPAMWMNFYFGLEYAFTTHGRLFMYAVYAAYNAVELISLVAFTWFAVKRCNRVPRGVDCLQSGNRGWAGFLSVALLPFLKFGQIGLVPGSP